MATAARSLQNVALAELAEQLQGDNAAKGEALEAKAVGW